MNVFNDCKMADSQNRLLSVIQEEKEILENLKADGNCRIPEEDLTDLFHEVRGRRRHKGLKCWFSVDLHTGSIISTWKNYCTTTISAENFEILQILKHCF
jgi:hypothetical protein